MNLERVILSFAGVIILILIWGIAKILAVSFWTVFIAALMLAFIMFGFSRKK